MKKLLMVICSIVLLVGVTVPAIAFGILNADKVLVRKDYSDVDYGDDEYLLRQEPKNWRKLDIGDVGFDEFDISSIDGSTATIPVTSELYRQVGSNEYFYPNHNKTSGAYKNLIYKARDVVLAVAPSDDIKELAEYEKVEFDITPFALDGFVFIVNKNNPVENLTSQQVKDIYSGKIVNWKDVGGNDEIIEPFQRNEDSGSQSAMVTFMGDTKLMTPLKARTFMGMGGMIDGVAKYDNGGASIGYTYKYYLNALNNDEVKAISIDGVAPTNDNFANGTYPIITSYYVVARSEFLEGSNAQKIKDFLLSAKGQDMIEMLGYCPIKSR